MILADSADLLATAGREPAAGPLATLGKSISSSFNETLNNETAMGSMMDVRGAYQREIDSIAKATGQRLDNPMDVVPGEFTGVAEGVRQRAQAEQDFADRVAKLRRECPDVRAVNPATRSGRRWRKSGPHDVPSARV